MVDILLINILTQLHGSNVGQFLFSRHSRLSLLQLVQAMNYKSMKIAYRFPVLIEEFVNASLKIEKY